MKNNPDHNPNLSLKLFELELADKFPELKSEFEEDEGLLHLHLATLYRYCQDSIASKKWEMVDKILKYVDECAKRKIDTLENAIRVSFLEYFDFQGDESGIKQRFGTLLVELYEEQMHYNMELAGISNSTYQERIDNRERGKRFACPCCGFDTISEPGAFEICEICFWEDDGQDDPIAALSAGGPNRLSLEDGRVNFLKFGASDPKDIKHVRKPNANDKRLRIYRLVDGKAVKMSNEE